MCLDAEVAQQVETLVAALLLLVRSLDGIPRRCCVGVVSVVIVLAAPRCRGPPC